MAVHSSAGGDQEASPGMDWLGRGPGASVAAASAAPHLVVPVAEHPIHQRASSFLRLLPISSDNAR